MHSKPQHINPKVKLRLNTYLPRLLVETGVSSCSIAHIENSAIVLTRAYGLQGPGLAATPATLYNIASMTKPISAEVVLRLVSNGSVALDEPMYRYWVDPDIASDERHKLLTPRVALSHQTGFPNWRFETRGVLTFKRRPGAGFSYSGEGYEYVARFIERKTGWRFEDLARLLVFDPAGMQDTAYTKRPWFRGRIAFPTNSEGTWLAPEIADKLIASYHLYTTAADYARFMLSIMNRVGVNCDIANQRSRIQVSRKRDICTPAQANNCGEDGFGFGLGWEILTCRGETFLWHKGTDYGIFTLGYFNLSKCAGTIIFTNSAKGAVVVVPILEMLGRDQVFTNFLRQRIPMKKAEIVDRSNSPLSRSPLLPLTFHASLQTTVNLG